MSRQGIETRKPPNKGGFVVAVPRYSLMKISCCNSSFFRIDVVNIAFLRHNTIKRGRNFTNLHEILRDLAIIAKSIFRISILTLLFKLNRTYS